MSSRLCLLSALFLSTLAASAQTASTTSDSDDEQANVTATSDQASAEQEEMRRQVITEEEDPQTQRTLEIQQESEDAELAQPVATEAVEADPGREQAQEQVKSEEEEPSFEREEEDVEPDEKDRFEGKFYGSIRLRYRITEDESFFGDAGSRAGAEGEWRTGPEAWVYGRVEVGFNVLDEFDQLLSPGGSSGEGRQGESVFPRLYTVGIETPFVVAGYGKTWSTYYSIANFTDRFDSAGSSAVGTFNAGTDGGATGTGRADQVLQTRAYIDFLPKTWKVSPFNLNIQLQSGQPIPQVDGADYQGAIGLSAVLESRKDFTFGVAYNLARIDDLDDPVVVAAGIKGDAEAFLLGARWFDEQWYTGFTVARLRNHETTDEGTYFTGWGSELYTRYRLTGGYWLVAGYNWLVPDADQVQAGEYELLYGVLGLRYSIDDFNRLAYAEWRLDSTVSENGDPLGDIFTIGVRWDF